MAPTRSAEGRSAPTYYNAFLTFLLAALITLVGHGCAPSYRGDIAQLTEAERWPEAVTQLQLIVAQQPDDAWARRELGRAQLNAGAPTIAVSTLRKAHELAPEHAGTLLFLAVALEETDQLDEALSTYVRAADMPGLPFELRDDARARAFALKRQLHRQRARELMAQPGAPAPGVLAVYRFSAGQTGASELLTALGKGVAEMLITDLGKIESLTLVERLQLEALLDEIQRSQDPAFDEDTRVEAGRLIGASSSVAGSIVAPSSLEVELAYFVASTQTGDVIAERSARGKLEDILALEKRIAYGTLELLSIEPTEEERREIGKVPTTSYPAFLAYCEGLHLEDEGRYEEALRKFRHALELDPGFASAATHAADLELVTAAGAATGDVREFAQVINRTIVEEAPLAVPEPPVAQRVDASARATGVASGAPDGSATGNDTSTPNVRTSALPPVESSGSAMLEIRLPLP